MPFPKALVQSEIEPYSGFELGSPFLFPMIVTVPLKAPLKWQASDVSP